MNVATAPLPQGAPIEECDPRAFDLDAATARGRGALGPLTAGVVEELKQRARQNL